MKFLWLFMSVMIGKDLKQISLSGDRHDLHVKQLNWDYLWLFWESVAELIPHMNLLLIIFGLISPLMFNGLTVEYSDKKNISIYKHLKRKPYNADISPLNLACERSTDACICQKVGFFLLT